MFAIKVTPEVHDLKNQSEIWREINEIRNLKRYATKDMNRKEFEFNKMSYCAVQRKYSPALNYDRKIIGSFSYTFFIFSNVFEGNMSQYDKQVKYFKQDKEF